MILRDAKEIDIDQMLALGFEMHQESRYCEMEFSREKVAGLFRLAIKDENYLFTVLEVNGCIVGGFIGYITPHWFSDEMVSGDFALFVDKEYRGWRGASILIKTYVKWAKDKGIKSKNIALGITTGIATEKTQALYKRLGFDNTGYVMNYRGFD